MNYYNGIPLLPLFNFCLITPPPPQKKNLIIINTPPYITRSTFIRHTFVEIGACATSWGECACCTGMSKAPRYLGVSTISKRNEVFGASQELLALCTRKA